MQERTLCKVEDSHPRGSREGGLERTMEKAEGLECISVNTMKGVWTETAHWNSFEISYHC